jgi:hypothetical protein
MLPKYGKKGRKSAFVRSGQSNKQIKSIFNYSADSAGAAGGV